VESARSAGSARWSTHRARAGEGAGCLEGTGWPPATTRLDWPTALVSLTLRIDLQKALDDTPGADAGLGNEVRALESRLGDVKTELEGDAVRRKRSEPTLPGIADRVQAIVDGSWLATSAPTQTQRDNYGAAARHFQAVLAPLTTLVEADLAGIEPRAEAAGAPCTPGRVPRWKP